MSSRRSGRAKAPVKYTSDSDDSDFGNKKPRKTTAKAAPKKRTKAEDEPAADSAAPPKKRAKKDPETVAAEESVKNSAAQQKASGKKNKEAWETWLEAHDVAGELLDEEPDREKSITQTDSLKKYGLKKEELGSLKHFEKRNPLYNNTIKLFLEEEVKTLGFRKAGILAGAGHDEDDSDILKRGETIWTTEHKDDPKEEQAKPDKKKAPKAKTSKQKWTAYVEAHTVASPDSLKEEPEEAINQSDCKTKYSLLPADLAVLPHFPKPNQKYGNTTKLFKESEVKTLAYRKAAVLGDVDEEDGELLEKGKALFEED